MVYILCSSHLCLDSLIFTLNGFIPWNITNIQIDIIPNVSRNKINIYSIVRADIC